MEDIIAKRLEELATPYDLLEPEVLAKRISQRQLDRSQFGLLTDDQRADFRASVTSGVLLGVEEVLMAQRIYAKMEHLRTQQLTLHEVRHLLWQHKKNWKGEGDDALQKAHDNVMALTDQVERELGKAKAQADIAWRLVADTWAKGGDVPPAITVDHLVQYVTEQHSTTPPPTLYSWFAQQHRGMSAEEAYTKACSEGFRGTMEQWLTSLPATKPMNGKGIVKLLERLGNHSVPTQDPKYRISPDHRLVNETTLTPIPEDEPVFILRAQDRRAAFTLRDYVERCQNYDHIRAVVARVDEFEAFAAAHPERMKEPDTGSSPQ